MFTDEDMLISLDSTLKACNFLTVLDGISEQGRRNEGA